MPVTIIQAELSRPDHGQAVIDLTDGYAREPGAGGTPLSDAVRAALVDGLRRHPTTLILLAYDSEQPVGIATCFRGYSTFAAKPLINIHDLAVARTHQGRGIGRALLAAVEERARELGCCKITLEVQEQNWPARRLYEQIGYAPVRYDDATGAALFLAKPL